MKSYWLNGEYEPDKSVTRVRVGTPPLVEEFERRKPPGPYEAVEGYHWYGWKWLTWEMLFNYGAVVSNVNELSLGEHIRVSRQIERSRN